MLGLSIPGVAYRNTSSLAARVNALFRSGEQGVWYDPSDRATMFQDSAGTTPVTAVEQPVGLILDKSGRGNHAFQSTSASRPVLSARVNLLTKTEQFDDAAWVGSATVTSNALAAPDGTFTADYLVRASASSDSRYQTATSASGVCSARVFVKKDTSPNSLIWLYDATAAAERLNINLTWSGSTPIVVASVGSVASPEDVGDGWWIITGTTTSLIQGNANRFYLLPAYTAAANGQKTAFWGADLRPTNSGINLPPYQRVNTEKDYDTAGFPAYLKFDGIDDFLVTNSIDFTATDKMTVCAGVSKLSDAVRGIVVELSAIYSNPGTFGLNAPGATLKNYVFGSTGTLVSEATTPSSYASPITNIVSGMGDISGDSAILRINGTQTAASTANQGTGNFGNYPLYIGRRGGTTLPFNGRLYSLIVRGAQSSDAQIASVERYVNGKTKAYT